MVKIRLDDVHSANKEMTKANIVFSTYCQKTTIPTCSSRVENTAIKLLMPPDPQVHDRHTLPCVLDLAQPPLIDQSSNPVLQLGAREQSLCLVRAHDAGAHRSAHDCSGVREKE